MKSFYRVSIYFLSGLIFYSCSNTKPSENSASSDDLEVIKIDLSEARDGKLSEFFEPEIEYVWLKDDSEESQLNAGLHKILFYEDKILTLDIFGCKCIKIFDREGNYLSKIRAYGEGPGKYLDLDNLMVVNNEVLVLGLYPPKLLWFSLEGDFLREEKLPKRIEAGVYDKVEKRYHFFTEHYQTEDFMVSSLNSDLADTIKFFLKDPNRYYGDYSGRNFFINNETEIYFAMSFQDTIYKYDEGNYVPELVLDFGKYGEDISDYQKKMNELESKERMDFINNKAKLFFVPARGWFINGSYFLGGFKYEKEFYHVFFDRRKNETHVIEKALKNDIDEGIESTGLNYNFGDNQVGFITSGVFLYEMYKKEMEDLGEEAFKEYVNGKGKKFAEVASAAKDSENPVLIIYTVKK